MNTHAPIPVTVQASDGIIREIERLGFKYDYEPQFDLTNVDASRRVQVREGGHYVPKDLREQYAAQMRESNQFPAIVVTRDNYIVDGNTRIEACRANKLNFFHCLILRVEWDRSDDALKNKLRALAATCNQLGGQRLTMPEAKAAAAHLIALGWTAGNISRALGLTPSLTDRVRREVAGRARLKVVGIKGNGFSDKAATILGATGMRHLRDSAFKHLAFLLRDANLSQKETIDIAKEVVAAQSDEEGEEILRRHRAEMEQRIVDHSLTGNGRPSGAALFRRILGQILAHDGKEENLVERETARIEEHVEKLRRAQRVLHNVMLAQEDIG